MERFLISDPCPTVSVGIRGLVGNSEGAEVVAVTTIPEETLRLTAELLPDRVVLDPRFDHSPEPLAESTLCTKLKSLPGPPSVSVYSTHDSPAELALLARAGADHYVHKGTGYEGLAEAWRRTRAGESVWMVAPDPDSAVPRLLAMLQGLHLSDRQLEVLVLLLRRYSDEQIARKLHITRQTTKNHNTNIFRKLGVKSRRELHNKFLV